MHEPRDFSFLQHDELWDNDEATKQTIHNLITGGDDILKSLEHKIRRSQYLAARQKKERTMNSFLTFTSADNMRIRKLRTQKLNRILRPYWEWLLKELGNECQICHKVFNSADLQVDHCQPLSRDGKNEWDNIQPLCRSCNISKHTKVFISDAVLSAQEEWKKLQKEEPCQKKP
jgi:5-methylcytosine-specific restriction endonuclease McrA